MTHPAAWLTCALGAVAFWTVGIGASHAEPGAKPICNSKIRAVHATLIDRDNTSLMIGPTAFMRALTKRVLEVAEVDAELHETPYARAVFDFGEGRADLVLMSEATMKQVDPRSTKVKMMRLPVVLYTQTPAQRHALGPGSIVGTLRGFPVPAAVTSSGARVYEVSAIDSLFKMLAVGRLSHALVVKANADIYLAGNPDMRRKIEESARTESSYMAAHVSSRLSAGCAERLARAARTVRATEMERMFARYVPELAYEDFKY